MQLSEIPDKFPHLKLVFATAIGLALGLAIDFFIPRPTSFADYRAVSISNFIFKWLYIIVGISIGVSQGLVLRKFTRGFFAWVIASTFGWTLAIGIGFEAVQVLFNTLTYPSGSPFSGTTTLFLRELLSGILFGCIIGLAQWLAIRSKFVKFQRWMIASISAWSTGLLIEGLIIIGIASMNDAYPSEVAFSLLYAGPSTIVHDRAVAIGISLIVGAVIGTITGTALFPQWLAFSRAAVASWKTQTLATKLSSGFGLAIVAFCMGLAVFVATKEFEALLPFNDRFPPPTGGVPSCISVLDLQPERKVVKENESIPLYATIHNGQNMECPATISLYTADFEFAPAETSKTVSIPPNETVTLMWMITPKRLGTYTIGLDAGTVSRTTAVSVVNMFGLNAQQAKLLSFLGTFFGPTLTFPWLLSAWQERKKAKAEKQTAEEQINNLRREIDELKRKKRVKRS